MTTSTVGPYEPRAGGGLQQHAIGTGIDPGRVHETLKHYQLVDGFDIVLDLERSHGPWLFDSISGRQFIDAFTFFASWPLGYNHPSLCEPDFSEELLAAARINPSNSDFYTESMAKFVRDFGTHVSPPGYNHHFWIAGGALAVENALKVAFDWKARKLNRSRFDDDVSDLVVLHFNQAFHGRSGYTLSLTNTVPEKTGLFPRFRWPRAHNPAIEYDLDGNIENDIEAEEARACSEIEAHFARCTCVGQHIAAIIIEPMQGEGGDNYFRPEFLGRLREYADAHEALLIFDEVQTGFYGSGRPWLWQHMDVAPDVVAFGKKAQVCGIYANARVDEVSDNVFRQSSRLNSTWGGTLVDMVRCRRLIEIIRSEGLAENIHRIGNSVLSELRLLAKCTKAFANVRGIGSMVAFSLASSARRDQVLQALYDRGVLAIASGQRSIRFRLPLVLDSSTAYLLTQRVADATDTRAS